MNAIAKLDGAPGRAFSFFERALGVVTIIATLCLTIYEFMDKRAVVAQAAQVQATSIQTQNLQPLLEQAAEKAIEKAKKEGR